MRRLLTIVLLALLPLQFSWAAVASYCEHEAQAGAGHFGHHDHPHHGDSGVDADPTVDPTADPPAKGDKPSVTMDFDCGHCHGQSSGMLTLSAGLPGLLAAAPPSAFSDEAGGEHSPTRPERPQWQPLA